MKLENCNKNLYTGRRASKTKQSLRLPQGCACSLCEAKMRGCEAAFAVSLKCHRKREQKVRSRVSSGNILPHTRGFI